MSRLLLVFALVMAAAAVVFATKKAIFEVSPPPPAHAHLNPSAASYLGIYEQGTPPSYAPITDFAQAVGKEPNLIAWFSGWAQPFPSSFAAKIRAHHEIPFVQIDPTFASVSGIAAGDYDGYLRSYANAVRNYRHAVVIGFGHEMNAPWYSWGYRNVPPQTFIAAWRHIVSLFRAQGADNVTWLWTINQDRSNTGPIQAWWPGSSYVTWIGIDGYYFRPQDDFRTVFGTTIDQVRKFTSKPILLSETAVGPRVAQFAKIGDLFAGMKKYDTLGLVWFDKDQNGGIYHQDWRIEGNEAAESAFRLGLASLNLCTAEPGSPDSC
jgi:mannan endo-1,4-beta-mannosidase